MTDAPRKRGRPSNGRTVEARVWLSPAEVALVDAQRGDTPRSEWMRAVVLERASEPLVPPGREHQ